MDSTLPLSSRQKPRQVSLPGLWLMLSLIGACSTTHGPAVDHTVTNAEDLLVVDCLLPPQVRQLGTHLTYLSQRRAIRTSGADCAIRGGEYVAYNRADFKTALAVWLPLAEQGDPEAQTYVGEIYEKGRGTRQSYEIAAGWYKRAANQGYSRAKINLGYLYESGLGVERDIARALNLYREASGFTAAELEFVSSREIANRKAIDNQTKQLKSEVQLLRSEILAGHKQLRAQEKQLRQSRDNYLKLQGKLATRGASTLENSDTTQAKQLSKHNEQLEKLQSRLVKTFSQKQSLQDQLTRQSINAAELEKQLSATQETLDAMKVKSATKKTVIEKLKLQNTLGKENADNSAQALKKANADYATLQKNITILEAENQTQIIWYKVQLSEAQQSQSALQRQIEQQQTAIAEIDLQRANEIASYQKKLIERGTQLTQAKLDNQSQRLKFSEQSASDQQQLSKLRLEIDNHEADLARQAKTINDLQSDLISKSSSSKSAMRSAQPSSSHHKKISKRVPLKNVELGSYHALVIGNDTYRSLDNLKTAGNDAIAVERILREKYGFKTVLLLDANQKTILSALERLRVTLGQQDNLLIYYAGHGELDRNTGSGYWLPVDADTTDKRQWIDNSAVTAMIDTMNAKHVLVIADSCYSGYLTRSSIARPLSGVSAELRLKWLRAVSQSRVRTVLSSGGTRPVLDGSENASHSIFATYFLEALETNTEVLETYELFFTLQQKVSDAAARLNVEQIPQYAPIRHAGHQAGEFIFAPLAQTTVGATASADSAAN
ncbi:MAG: caspase family protein [Granulosicoccus sp.]